MGKDFIAENYNISSLEESKKRNRLSYKVDYSFQDLNASVFTGIHFVGANFIGANLSYTIFNSCIFELCDFYGADLTEACFMNCSFDIPELKGIRYDDGIRYDGVLECINCTWNIP